MAIYDNYYIEIATSCKATLAMTMCGYCHCERSEAIHKPQKVNTKNKKEKEFPAFYQVKKLIFNEILIFNFQFLIFNFLWIATSCKATLAMTTLFSSLRAKRSNP